MRKLFGVTKVNSSWRFSSSLVLPEPVMEGYYDSTWNVEIVPGDEYQDALDSELSGYLHWVEENSSNNDDLEEIDRLADEFIESCHEKFRLEKVESYRRYQEMMARSM
ncbi:hypothetical protein GIB67_010382 [Kingdonia uniflora]|uniref:Uncharacterized protein n=1 Tax=Kingdonia uniflora TaxID=39325 RepID=A0A7J7MAN2_9MAGN|nr:hypothetical protein GIB67_010382 [Kingdonia uniflora]